MALTRNRPGALLAALCLLGAGSLLAAEVEPASPIFDQAELESLPVPTRRIVPDPPQSHQPDFSARLTFAYVVDELGQTGDVTLVEAQATLAASGRIIQESDLPALRRTGLLIGLPENASFQEINALLTRPFLEPGRASVRTWRYRPGRRNGVAVATRVTDVVLFRADDLLPLPARQPVSRPPAVLETTPQIPPNPPIAREPTPAVEPFRPNAPPDPSRSVIAVIPLPGGGMIQNPGTPPITVVPVSGSESIIYTPGQPQSTITSNPGGGSTIFTPGQPPTTVVPVSRSESIIFTPGQPQSTVVATPGGGSTIYTPGQAPTTIVPIAGGGSIIYAPGQPPVMVMPNP